MITTESPTPKARIHVLVLVAVLTGIVWAGFTTFRARLLEPCLSNCTTFTDYTRHDPFCLTDASCISPFYKTSATGVQHWAGGLGWRLESGEQPPSATSALALPNYFCFLALSIAATALVARHPAMSRIRLIWFAAILTWCTAEIASWYVDLSELAQGSTLVLISQALVVWTVSLSVLALTYQLLQRSRWPRSSNPQ